MKKTEMLVDAVVLVLDKFDDLTDNFSSSHTRWKVLAGIVMTTGTDVRDAKVISVSTGTKCISGKYMSDCGLALNDCHAERISQRSLLRFLYIQLELYLNNKDDQKRSIFQKWSEKGLNWRGMFSFICISAPLPVEMPGFFSAWIKPSDLLSCKYLWSVVT